MKCVPFIAKHWLPHANGRILLPTIVSEQTVSDDRTF